MSKFLILAVITISAMALAIASDPTAVAVINAPDGTTYKGGMWQTCVTDPSGNTNCMANNWSCNDLTNVLQADEAFSIIATIVFGFLVIVYLLRQFVGSYFAGETGTKAILIILYFLGISSGVIAWAAGFAAYAGTFCGQQLSNLPGVSSSMAGPSAPCMLVGWFLIVVASILDCALESPAAADAAPK